MASVEIVGRDGDLEVRVYPYDRNLFLAFSTLFWGNQFDSKKYARVKKTLSIVREFRTAESQLVPFEKFEESVNVCSALGFSRATGKHVKHFNELFARYRKLVRLIANNSVLLQHFGIEEEGVAVCICDRYLVGQYWICKNHTFKGNRLEMIAAGHMNSEKLHMPCNYISAFYTWPRFLKDRVNGNEFLKTIPIEDIVNARRIEMLVGSEVKSC